MCVKAIKFGVRGLHLIANVVAGDNPFVLANDSNRFYSRTGAFRPPRSVNAA